MYIWNNSNLYNIQFLEVFGKVCLSETFKNRVVTFFWVLDNAKGYGVSAIIPITLVLPLSN